MNEHYDALETRAPAERERALMAALPSQVAHAQARATAFAQRLKDVAASGVTSRAALARLPVTRKHDLMERQHAERERDVFGGFSAIGWGQAKSVFQSPGRIYEPEGAAPDYWRVARALFAAGFRAGDLAHNGFSYHFTPAGSMMQTGAQALGCTVFPGGTGQTELQVQAIADLKPAGYMGTPSFLKLIVEKAAEMGTPIPSLKKAAVGAEAFPPSLRDWFHARGIDGYQSYGTADLGLVAYETSAREGLVLDEDVIVEIVRPGTGDPVPDGEVGEVVVTTFNPDYPMVRLATGDLSAIQQGISPCGRTNVRVKGWMGRADQTAKVKGMFVHPRQVAEVGARHPELGRLRLVVGRAAELDTMTLLAECACAEGLASAVAQTLQSVTKLKGEVRLVASGSLPNDGKVIADERPVG